MNLNSKEAQKAWEDYKGFMENMGRNFSLNHSATKEIEQAFKFGYVQGENVKTKEPVAEMPSSERLAQKMQSMGIGPKKAPGRRRSDKELEQDARLVASIMQRNGAPMRLQSITIAVNGAGGDWYDKSASGHMAKVMDRVPAIKKIGFGLYEYQQ